jgi:tRNA threonylcarbamoyladenosine modification (KEOPS) complex  Pcc1 subunit
VYSVKITRTKDASHLKDVFEAENTVFPNGRASYSVKKREDTLHITAEATDTSALKAVLNSITTILELYDKSKQISE